jgi:primosomal protein N' (replication factor Y)
MPTFVEVIVNVPQAGDVFHYHLPQDLEGKILPGHLVVVPFGQQKVQGVVVQTVPQASVPYTRPIIDLVDPQPVLTQHQLSLAKHLAKSSLSSLAACVHLMLPPGLSRRAESVYSLVEDQVDVFEPGSPLPLSRAAFVLTEAQKRLLDLLRKRGPLRSGQFERALPRHNWRASLQALVRHGLVISHTVLPEPKVRPKMIRTAQLACLPEEAEAAMPNLARVSSKALKRRQAMLKFLIHQPGPVDVTWLYAESAAQTDLDLEKGGSLADLRSLAERGLVILGESEIWRDPLAEIDAFPTEPPSLTSEQQATWQVIEQQIIAPPDSSATSRFFPILLHGVTGSGKTEIYLHAVAQTLMRGRQVIVLVPEIALTPQTVRRFMARFPGQVGVIHSQLSEGERYDTWRRARLGLLSVIIGPRSALFTPLADIGLIVVDECHDESYYQSGHPPAYHARELAVAYAQITQAICLLGSATPDVVNLYHAQQGGWCLLRLPQRILGHRDVVNAQTQRMGLVSRYRPLEGQAETMDLPPVQVMDMRKELKEGNRSIFSRALQVALAEVLANHQQAILFLNRRGTATYVFCRDCGFVLKCPRCDLPLAYHANFGNEGAGSSTPPLRCHHCGYERGMPKTCPQCGSQRIRQYGTGTEKVEAAVMELFPQARTLRWDWDTTRQKGAHEFIMSHFANHRADVLIGTQMLAKGLDLPLVTLVGVVLADVGLNLPDYRAAERVFQVLMQVAGRAGRSPLGGQVILQTFQPDHYVIQAAAKHDYQEFYLQELAYRRQLGYPPFSQLVRLEYRANDPGQAERETRKLASQIQIWLSEEDRRATEMIGPVPCFFSRIGGRYRWQIVLRGPDPASLLRGHPLTDFEIQVNPPNLL